MKKEIKQATESGIIRITTTDERWYTKEGANPETLLPEFVFVPSSTWISGFYPKGIQFYKWLAEHGWDESQAIKNAAGDKGSKIHAAIECLLNKQEVAIDSKFVNKSTGQEEELTTEEYEAIMSFREWFNYNKPEVIATEQTVWNDKHNYAGTLDFICKLDGEYWIIDFKSSQDTWEEYKLQISSYKHALVNTQQDFTLPADFNPETVKLGILHVGYRRNKAGYKMDEIEDKFDLFLTAQKIWANECAGDKPKQRDYPVKLALDFTPFPEKVEEKPKKKSTKPQA